MSAQGIMLGTRLEFVVVPLEGTVKRKQYKLVPRGKTTEGVKRLTYDRKEFDVEQPAGYMVYFPRGHVIRLKNKDQLRQYGLDRAPKLINLQGLNDPNSALGKLMTAQDDASRAEAMTSLERKVIALATAKTGRELLSKEAA